MKGRDEPCSVDGCEDRIAYVKARLCNMHYLRLRIHGDVLADRPHLLRTDPYDRFLRYVDKDGPICCHSPLLGRCWMWVGSLNAGGYGRFWWNQKFIAAHRFS